MLGIQLEQISKSLTVQVLRSNKTNSIEPELALDLTICWFLRLWFLAQLDPTWLDSILKEMESPECPHTGFQIVRILFERGIHEPSIRHRATVEKLCPTIEYRGPKLESTEWWEDTLIQNGFPIVLEPEEFTSLINLARLQTSPDEIVSLFPQINVNQIYSQSTLISSTHSVLLAKLYLRATIERESWTDLAALVQLNPSLEYDKRRFPPESSTREYKATFRWDSQSSQKNSFQAQACLKTVCGFLNNEGGTLIIGVDDARNVIGLAGDFSLIRKPFPYDEFVQIIHESVKKYIHPIPIGLLSVNIQPYGSHQIAIISIQASSQVHSLATKPGESELYVRDGNRTLRLNPQEANLFLESRNK